MTVGITVERWLEQVVDDSSEEEEEEKIMVENWKSEELKNEMGKRNNKRKMIYHWKNGENNKKNFTKKNVSYKSGKTIKEWRSKEIAKVTESKRERGRSNWIDFIPVSKKTV